MIDTVKLIRGYEHKPPVFWQDAGFTFSGNRHFFNQPDKPRLTVWYYNGNPYLSAEFSIPHLLYGHNAQLPLSESQAFHAIETACSFAGSITNLPFQPDSTKVRRIDFARDFQIQQGTDAASISQALFAKTLTGMTRHAVENSICFERQTSHGLAKRILVYPKLDEVLSRPSPTSDAIGAATNKVRLEVRLQGRGLDVLLRSCGGVTPTHLVSDQVSELIIRQAMEQLDFQSILAAPRKDFFEYFTSVTSDTREYDLYWFGEAVRRHGVRFHKNTDFHYSDRKFYRNKKRCEQLGIWEHLVNSSLVQLAMSNTCPDADGKRTRKH